MSEAIRQAPGRGGCSRQRAGSKHEHRPASEPRMPGVGKEETWLLLACGILGVRGVLAVHSRLFGRGVSSGATRVRLCFPRDHYAHGDFRTEWWYYTGHLRAKSGRGIWLPGDVLPERPGGGAGNSPSRWAAKNLYLAHFAMSDIPRKDFRYFERINRAGLGQQAPADGVPRLGRRLGGEGRRTRAAPHGEGG